MARIVVGMSGGVDSAVTAYLLHREGHEVIGVFMNNWEETDDSGVCTAERDFDDVRRVCETIGIPYYSVNFAKEYRENVFSLFLDEYRRGRTPNPDVLCNREIKFKVFHDFALSLGAEKVATGHFAQLRGRDGKMELLRARDENKDQTYFLYMLSQPPLRNALFPVGHLTKPEIRDIAREAGLAVSEKKDSTGVCFIGERNFKQFLKGFLPALPGDMVDVNGNTVGRHDGLMYYTLGQRRGLGIGGSGTGERWFVVEKDLKNNRLIVEQGADSPRLYTMSAECEAETWISGECPVPDTGRVALTARFRHRQPLQKVWAERSETGGIRLIFAEKQRAVTPGQAAVLYDGEVCLGGATIS